MMAGVVRHEVDGYAMGGGTEIALACDLVVASDQAAFGLPEVKRGLLAAAGGVVRLQRQIPSKLARLEQRRPLAGQRRGDGRSVRQRRRDRGRDRLRGEAPARVDW